MSFIVLYATAADVTRVQWWDI